MTEYVNPIEELVHSTLRIECETPQGISSGSGYFYAFLEGEDNTHVPCIVTNKHVIKGATRGKFFLSVKNENGKPDPLWQDSCHPQIFTRVAVKDTRDEPLFT